MKFYNAEKLFIGPVGYARRIDRNNIQFVQKEITVTRQKNGIGSMDYYYFDVLSNKKYIDFHNIYCISGDPCIFEPMSLALLIKQAYNKTQKSEIINSLAERVLKGKKISEKDIKEIVFYLNNHHKSIYIEETNEIIPKEKQNNKTESTNIDFITILTEKKFKNEPAIGRDKEVNDLIIALAQDKKNPILVGPSGTGKTTIADQLAYKIQKGNVPEFLKNKKIIEIDLANLLSGTKYSGTLEEKFTNLISLAVKNDAIIFIDEIHTIYGAGTHDKSDYDIAAMLKQAIDRQGLKVIGTTTSEEYEKYFSNDALKRRFEKVLVDEPNEIILYNIINKVFNDYSSNNNIKLLSNMGNIIDNLIELTDSKHRTWNDKVCNPDLVIGIVDKIFADAKVNNQKELTIENIIYGINSCNRVYNSSKEDVINNLNIEEKPKAKIIELRKGR